MDRREHQRLQFQASVSVGHPQLGTMTCMTADISEGGVFLRTPGQVFALGDIVTVQVCGMEDAPLIRGRVVHLSIEGIGLSFRADGEPR